MAYTYGKPAFFSRLEIDSGNQNFTTTAGTGTVPSGFYFLDDPTDASSVRDAFQDAIVGTGGACVNTTVTISRTTGLCTIVGGVGGTYTLTWDDPDLALLFGFAIGSASVVPGGVTGTSQCQFFWNPNCYPGDSEDSAEGAGHPVHGALGSRGIGGAFYGTSMTALTDKRVTFAALPARKIWTQKEQVVNEAYQTFWAASVKDMKRIRYYPDRDVFTTTSYHDFVPSPKMASELGAKWIGAGQPYSKLDVLMHAYVAG